MSDKKFSFHITNCNTHSVYSQEFSKERFLEEVEIPEEFIDSVVGGYAGIYNYGEVSSSIFVLINKVESKVVFVSHTDTVDDYHLIIFATSKVGDTLELTTGRVDLENLINCDHKHTPVLEAFDEALSMDLKIALGLIYN